MAAVVGAAVLAAGGYFLGVLDLHGAVVCTVVVTLILGQLMGGGNEEAAALVGKAAPDVTLTEVATGQTKQLSEYLKSGRPTLIDFYQCGLPHPVGPLSSAR